MKKIYTLMAAVICCFPVWAQTRVMKVVQTDGTVVTYKVANVQEVSFDERTMPTLQNQYAVNEEAFDIDSVTRGIDGLGSRFEIFDAEGTPRFNLWVTDDAMGRTHDLATASGEDVRLTAYTPEGDVRFMSGSLRVAFDKFGKNLTVDFTGEAGNDDWAIKYQGPFSTHYVSRQSIEATPDGGEPQSWQLKTALRMAPAEVGEPTRFVFAPAEGTTTAEMPAGDCAVLLSLPASALAAGSLDLSETGTYVLKFYQYTHDGDNTTFTVRESVLEGKVTYAETEDGRVYVKVNALFADSTRLETEYYGEPTAMDNIDGLEPKVFLNLFTHFDADGNIATQQNLTGAEYRVKSGKTNIYFMYDGADTSDERGRGVPLLILPESMMENGTYQLAEAAEGFEFKYDAIQLAVGQWRNAPDNGMLTIEKDDEGNITIILDVVNTYTVDMGSSVTKGGTPELITITYKGTFTAR